MLSDRVEIRLGDERRQKLAELAQTKGVGMSEVVRVLIDDAYELFAYTRRLEAVERIAAANVEDVPGPETLQKQLNSTYDIPNLY